VSDSCIKHSFETAAGVCRQCRNAYCSECLVFAFGEDKPPYCVTCALNVAGVRHHGAKPNPRLRKRGLFGRKVIVDEEPRPQKSFDEIEIVLPQERRSAPMINHSARREVAPEVLAMVRSAESDFEFESPVDAGVGGVTVTALPEESSLAEWAASLDPSDGSDAAFDDALPESSSVDAWPEDSIGRLY
jgi:hypothetical protein